MKVVRAGGLGLALLTAACSMTTVGGGSDSPASGSAGPQGSRGTEELHRCPGQVVTVALATSELQNQQVFVNLGIAPDPLPAMRLIAQQSGCFRIVNRDVALQNIRSERDFAKEGELSGKHNFAKGQLVGADYTILTEVMVSNSNSGGIGGTIARVGLSFIPYVGAYAGMAMGGLQAQEAQVQLTLVDNHTGVQIGVVTGKGSGTSFSLGGGMASFGATGGSFGGAGGYMNTDQGKVVMAAMIDAMNNLEPVLPGTRPSH